MTASSPRAAAAADLLLRGVSAADADAVCAGDSAQPHRVLGAHPAEWKSAESEGGEGRRGVVVRAFHPDAALAECLIEGRQPVSLQRLRGGLFAAFLPGLGLPLRYRLRFHFAGGATWERDDPYRFLPTLGDVDLHLFNEGTHRRLWEVLGARPREVEGTWGTAFSVWAPNARRVSVVGDFCGWDGRLLPMRSLGNSGVFELFVPGVEPGALYKYELKTAAGALRLKTDPMATAMELPPGSASRVVASSYAWSDGEWMARREGRDWPREPISIYELHLGSWARVPEEWNRPLGYREIAPRLAAHARRLGFTHVELLPVAEHPLYASWGYQVTGYYAPSSRYGSPDDLRFLVDTCHQHGLGVILDWVPAHFPKDDFALRRFDGTALYEHEDPRLGEHPDWGTLIFNYGRNEVRGFLLANALYWLREFHVDGLRIDAVASMIYLDYSRREGEWLANPWGGKENVDAIEFLRALNVVLGAEVPSAFTVAEESTSWAGVTRPVHQGGLGFTFKWNMGWMHDTLGYFSHDPVHRRWHQNELSFATLYELHERFIMPLSHDEVVHGKGSLLQKMPGDLWQKLANLRALLTYQFTRPGKQLLFMGVELAQPGEWVVDQSLDWHLAAQPERQAFMFFLEELGRLYHGTSCLWRRDPDPDGFRWIDCDDAEHSVYVYERRAGEERVLVVLNLTPVPREDYRIGVPLAGRWTRVFCSDDRRYGGSEFETLAEAWTEPVPWQREQQSLRLRLPPLGALVLAPAGG